MPAPPPSRPPNWRTSRRFPPSAISCSNPAPPATSTTGRAMDRSHRLLGSAIAAVFAIVMLGQAASAQQAAPIVLYTSTEQISLKAYAEFMRSGILQLVSGSPKDIPTVNDVSYFRCGLTGWSPKGVLV